MSAWWPVTHLCSKSWATQGAVTALCSLAALAFCTASPRELLAVAAVPGPSEVGRSHRVPAGLHHHEAPVRCRRTDNMIFPLRAALNFC